MTDDPTTTALETLDAGVIACKGIRSTSEFPRDLAGLSAEQIAHHYGAMRNSHASLVRARDSFLARLHGYEQRLAVIGQEKAEALAIAQELHRELEAFETRQAQLDRVLTDLEDAKEQAGFWSILRITELIDRMRTLLRGGH